VGTLLQRSGKKIEKIKIKTRWSKITLFCPGKNTLSAIVLDLKTHQSIKHTHAQPCIDQPSAHLG